MADGDYSTNLPIHSNDELGELTRLFNKMQIEIQSGLSAPIYDGGLTQTIMYFNKNKLEIKEVKKVLYLISHQILDLLSTLEVFLENH